MTGHPMVDLQERALMYGREFVEALARGPGGLILSSVIIHGSVGFKDIVEGRSDLDILVIGDAPDEGLTEVAAEMVSVPRPEGFLGLETSLVNRENIADLTPDRPFRLHVNHRHAEPVVVLGTTHPGDKDLTLHYAVARASGISLFGDEPRHVVPPQPRDLILLSLLSELEWASQQESFYALLNASRAAAFAREGLLLSKLSGWLWARRHGGPAAALDHALVTYLMAEEDEIEPPMYRTDVEDYLRSTAGLIRAAVEPGT